jgi:hypothetical protein
MDWATLMTQPAVYVDLARLVSCFDNQVSAGLCERLRGASRLHDRLSALIIEHYALAPPIPPEAMSELDRTIALLPVARVADLVRRAGAVYWAKAIANAVRADEVKWLHEQLGGTLYAFALANRSSSGTAEILEPLAGAAARIAEDGMRCLGAWCQSQPGAVGSRVRLKSAASPALDDPPQSPFDELGPAIVRCAAC